MTIEMGSSAMDNTIIGKGKVGSHQFMMYDYKIALCPRTESHVWEKCLYAHRGERARRRHPSKYQAVQCPEARAKKACPRGDDCNCTHHLFEYWLHPDRYMTCLCELGPACNRPICFFAHHQSELRPLPSGLTHPEEDALPSRRRERQQRSANPSSPGNSSNDPLAFVTKGPGSSSGGGVGSSFAAPGGGGGAAAAAAGATSVSGLNRPDLAGLLDAYGALELLSAANPSAATATAGLEGASVTATAAAAAGVGSVSAVGNAAVTAAQLGPVSTVSTASQPGLQQRLSVGSDPAGPSSQLQIALAEAVAAEASQRQRASSAPSLASSSSYTLLTQQQPQLPDAQQKQQVMLLGPVSRQGSGGGQSTCSGNSSVMLPVLTGVRTANAGLELFPMRLPAGSDRLTHQAVRPGLDMQAVRSSLEMPAGMAGSMSSGGYSPSASAQLQLQQQLSAHLRTQSGGLSLSAMSSMSLPGSTCSSPLALANSSPVTLNPAALQILSPPVMVGRQAAFQPPTSAMLDTGVVLAQQQQQQQQLQQQHIGNVMPAVVVAPRGVQQMLGQLQPQHRLGSGLAYIQAAGQTLLLQPQQQLMPVQVVDDPNEQLSFSMWAPDGTYLLPTQPPIPQQQQQLQYVQLQQPTPNFWQQQNCQQQPVALLSVNSNQAAAVGPEFQGWQQQQPQQQLSQLVQQQQLRQMQQQQLPDPRRQGAWP